MMNGFRKTFKQYQDQIGETNKVRIKIADVSCFRRCFCLRQEVIFHIMVIASYCLRQCSVAALQTALDRSTHNVSRRSSTELEPAIGTQFTIDPRLTHVRRVRSVTCCFHVVIRNEGSVAEMQLSLNLGAKECPHIRKTSLANGATDHRSDSTTWRLTDGKSIRRNRQVACGRTTSTQEPIHRELYIKDSHATANALQVHGMYTPDFVYIYIYIYIGSTISSVRPVFVCASDSPYSYRQLRLTEFVARRVEHSTEAFPTVK